MFAQCNLFLINGLESVWPLNVPLISISPLSKVNVLLLLLVYLTSTSRNHFKNVLIYLNVKKDFSTLVGAKKNALIFKIVQKVNTLIKRRKFASLNLLANSNTIFLGGMNIVGLLKFVNKGNITMRMKINALLFQLVQKIDTSVYLRKNAWSSILAVMINTLIQLMRNVSRC